jgi:(2Fe-2S) ferredoxin
MRNHLDPVFAAALEAVFYEAVSQKDAPRVEEPHSNR